MKRFFVAAFAVGAVAVASFDCGGKVGSIGEQCPATLSGACTSGATCVATETDSCGHSGTVDCTCASGGWSCPAYQSPTCKPSPPPPPACTSAVDGQSCTVSGESCIAAIQPTCPGEPPSPPAYCSCDGARFHCPPVPDCPVPPPPPPSCPPPQTVTTQSSCTSPGVTCTGEQSYLDCSGVLQLTSVPCLCGSDDLWSCPIIDPPPCATDAGMGK